jgi:hypothetical protein
MPDLAEMVDAAQPKVGKRGPYKKQAGSEQETTNWAKQDQGT